MEPAAVVFTSRIEPEEQARADFYALLARLYAAEPDAALLRSIAGADELEIEEGNAEGETLAEAWRMLIAASAVFDVEAAAAEYLELFVGVGASAVSPHASAYEKVPGRQPLVEVRAALARLSLSRQPGNVLYEDHLAAIFATMRALITGVGAVAFSIDEQRAFFTAHVDSWVVSCCDAINRCSIANYYQRVAQLTKAFVAVERDSFAIG
ncbi:MAG TPA: molecular chaperone TorD family protein [Casimicrobiaceae bacterium]|jgi:TorA maturation chaperone TorD